MMANDRSAIEAVTAAQRTWEERVEADDLEEHAADAPHVHLVVVVAVGQQALGGAVPAGRGRGLLAIRTRGM